MTMHVQLQHRLMALCDRCLSENVASFWTTIKDLVDELEDLRKQCQPGPDKLLLTKLLFILARCSRLVLLQDASPYVVAERERSMYNTMPRPVRHVFHTSTKPRAAKDAPAAGSMSVNIRRTATVPSRTPGDVATGIAQLKLSDIPSTGTMVCSVACVDACAATCCVVHGISTAASVACTSTRLHPGGAARARILSPLGRSVVTRTLEAELDQVAADQGRVPLSEPSTSDAGDEAITSRPSSASSHGQGQRRKSMCRCCCTPSHADNHSQACWVGAWSGW